MRVCFYCADQHPERDRTRGISLYTTEIARALSSNFGVEIAALCSRSSLSLHGSACTYGLLPFRTDGPVGRIVADECHRILTRLDGDIWHYPKGFLPRLFRPNQPFVATIHDAILPYYTVAYPSHRSRAAYAYWLMRFDVSLRQSREIITISKSAARQIGEYCIRKGIPPPAMKVIYPGVRWADAGDEPQAKQDYVLHLASKEPHKKTNQLLAWWRRLEGTQKDLPELVVLGATDVHGAAILAELRRVRVMPPTSRDELMTLLRNARALLFPSEIEGFGLPALEAYSAGTPVVYQRGTAVEEVLLSSPGGFEGGNFESFSTTMRKVIGFDRATVQRITSLLHGIYSWDRCAAETITFYREVLGRSKGR